MNYQHHYHAGNFADVCKHLVLAELIHALQQKEAPFGYLETHAGAGLYDLSGLPAQTTQEFLRGIAQLMAAQGLESLRTVQQYKDAVNQFGYPHYYPGSPCLVRAWARLTDRLVLIEKHKETLQTLKAQFVADAQVAIHARDAYEGLQALLPLKQSRGLIFIDPAYEQPDEWERLTAALGKALPRYRQGIVVLWYPIKSDGKSEKMVARLCEKLPAGMAGLNITMSVFSTDMRQGLIGGGMLVLNPPWHCKEQIMAWLPGVWKVLSGQGQGAFSVKDI